MSSSVRRSRHASLSTAEKLVRRPIAARAQEQIHSSVGHSSMRIAAHVYSLCFFAREPGSQCAKIESRRQWRCLQRVLRSPVGRDCNEAVVLRKR